MSDDIALRKYGEAFDFYAECGSCLPKTYTVIDCETTGFSPAYDCMMQIAHTEVVDGTPYKRGVYVFNWLNYDYLPKPYVLKRMSNASQQFEKNGGQFRFSAERLLAEGRNPKQIIELYAAKLQALIATKTCLVGHNVKFDLSMLAATAELFTGVKLPVDGLRVVDTGALVKLHQAGWHPERGDTLADFTRRTINRPAAGVKWSLTDFAIPHYLTDVTVDPAKAHEADYDVDMTHRLLEQLRELGDNSAAPAKKKSKVVASKLDDEDTFMGEPIAPVKAASDVKRSGVIPRKKRRRSS